MPVEQAGRTMGLAEAQGRRAFAEFTRKYRTTKYLRMQPLSAEPTREPELATVPVS